MKVKHVAIRILTAMIFAASIVSVAHADKQREDIAKLIEMTGSLKLMDQMTSLMLPQIMNVVRAANSSIPETVLREFEQVAIEEFGRSHSEFTEGVIVIYEANFTHREIKDIIAFYETSTGKKVVETLPKVMQQSMVLGQAWGKAVGERVLDRIIRKAREKGYDL